MGGFGILMNTEWNMNMCRKKYGVFAMATKIKQKVPALIYMFARACVYICIYIYVYIYVCVCVCVCACVCVCVCVYIQKSDLYPIFFF